MRWGGNANFASLYRAKYENNPTNVKDVSFSFRARIEIKNRAERSTTTVMKNDIWILLVVVRQYHSVIDLNMFTPTKDDLNEDDLDVI